MGLFDVKYQSFEVFAFWMIYIDRMVGGLCELMQYSHFTPALGCSREYREPELFAGDGL